MKMNKRQWEAKERFMETVEACKAAMHPEDVTFEPKNFTDWMESCDSRNCDGVTALRDTVKRGVANAEPGSVYRQLRTHFLAYAEAAMLRRFPAPVRRPPPPDFADIPF